MKKGFTLIEMLVVVGVVGLVLPTLFSILFVILIQQTKIYRLAEVKRQGDYVLGLMKNTIKNNAFSTHSAQPTDGNEICTSSSPSSASFNYFRDKTYYGSWFAYSLDGSNRIASESSAIATVNLTTDKVRVDSFTMSCKRSSSFSAPVVSVAFTLCYVTNAAGECSSDRSEDTASMTYKTNIKINNP